MLSRGIRFVVFKLPALAYMAFIFWMSSGPVTSSTLQSMPDYVLHAFGYSALYLLVFWAIHEGIDTGNGYGGYWLPAVITILYGISDEFHQYFIPTRECSARDAAADAVGALIGIGMLMLAVRLVAPYRDMMAFLNPNSRRHEDSKDERQPATADPRL